MCINFFPSGIGVRFHFRAEMVKLLKENDLIPDDYPLPWNNKKKRTRTKASQDLG